MTDETFVGIVLLLERAFRITFDRDDRKVWWMILGDLPDDLATAAAVDLCRTHPYAVPKPADLWMRCQPKRAGVATLAWLDAVRAVANPYASARFDDRIIPLVIEALGGVRKLASEEWNDLASHRRRDFERLYEAFSVEGRAHPTGYLPGIVETENRAHGHTEEFPVLQIGHGGREIEPAN